MRSTDPDRNATQSTTNAGGDSSSLQDASGTSNAGSFAHLTSSSLQAPFDPLTGSPPSTGSGNKDSEEMTDLQDQMEASREGVRDLNLDQDEDMDIENEDDAMSVVDNTNVSQLDIHPSDLSNSDTLLEDNENSLNSSDSLVEALDDSDTDPDPSPSNGDDDEDNFNTQQQADLDLISKIAQAEFSRQPKSTQLILTKEAARMFQDYGRHGSAARLAARTMKFLEQGDFVTRQRKYLSKEKKTVGGDRIGGPPKTEKVVVKVKERMEWATLQFEKLPAIERREDKDDGKWKRKETKAGELTMSVGMRKTAEFGGGIEFPARKKLRGLDDVCQQAMKLGLRLENGDNAGEWLAGKHEVDINAPVGEKGQEYDFMDSAEVKMRQERSLQRDGTLVPELSTPVFVREAEHSTTRLDDVVFRVSKVPLRSLESFAPHPAILDHSHPHALSNDAETHALLTDFNTIPFRPVDLTMEFPIGTYFPTNTLQSINRIFQLYELSAFDLVRHLTLRYQPYALHSQDDDIDDRFRTFPAPPLALFRVAVAQYFSLQLATIFKPAEMDDLYMGPHVRGLLREVYDNVQGGLLNRAEKEILTRASRMPIEDAIEVFWEQRNIDLRAWNALKVWRRGREMESIVRAKNEGRY